MSRRFIAFLLLTTSAAFPACAAVTPATYFFYALVTNTIGAGSNPAPGSVVPISITVDTSFPADTQMNHVTTYSGGGLNGYPSPLLAASINGENVLGLSQVLAITQDLNGVYEIEIQTFASQSGGTLELTLKTGLKGIVKSDKIPKQVFPGNFRFATFSTSDKGVVYSGQIID